MIADSQLAQLHSPGMQPCSATTVEHACALCQDQTGMLHMFCDTIESESCLVKAPAKHASELVLVFGELLCTGVQANTERHTRKETREMCSCWGYQTTPVSSPSGNRTLSFAAKLSGRKTFSRFLGLQVSWTGGLRYWFCFGKMDCQLHRRYHHLYLWPQSPDVWLLFRVQAWLTRSLLFNVFLTGRSLI